MKKYPWWQTQIGKEEYKLIKLVLKSNFPNEGQFTTQFENEVSKLLKVKHTVAVTSGTAALFLSLKAVGVGAGDEVIVPDLTFISTVNAVEMTGAKPVIVDVNAKTLNIDVKKVTKAITKKTKAIIPVHVSGRHADIIEVVKIAKKHKLFVVEDAAEAFMSKFQGKYLGTFGDTGCFSLSPFKTITTGQGGLIVTNDDKLHIKLKALKDQGRPTRGTGGNDLHDMIGYNFKFSNLQAAVGIGQLTYLQARIKRMRKNYLMYKKYLQDVGQITIFEFNIKDGELPQWVDGAAENRDRLDDYLQSVNIDCRKLWYPIHQQKPYKQDDKKFPNSTKISPKVLWLPSAFTFTNNDIKTICNHIKRFYNR